ncbi:MAG TPA: hypothetical protein VHZ55_35685, partial [Bryobacteraceae bacterium]|nr:hypothetical protein [Bryobacteraceae bacterium]
MSKVLNRRDFIGYGAAGTGIGLDRPNVVGNPYVRITSTSQWISAGAFVPNPLGTFGNAGSDSLAGPMFFNCRPQLLDRGFMPRLPIDTRDANHRESVWQSHVNPGRPDRGACGSAES